MKLKPKSTVKNPKALLYKRFINLEKSENLNTIYQTNDGKYWSFDVIEMKFREIEESIIQPNSNIVVVKKTELFSDSTTPTHAQILYYKNIGYIYNNSWGNFDLNSNLSNNKFAYINKELLPNEEISGVVSDYSCLFGTVSAFYELLAFHTNNFSTFSCKIYAMNIVTKEEEVICEGTITATGTAESNDIFRCYMSSNQIYITTKIEYTLKNNTSEVQNINARIENTYVLQGTLSSAGFNNIGKYQTNKYYYSGSFDYIIKGSIEGTTTQYIKGNIVPLTSLNIKFYDDDITLTTDDLVVIDGHLYSVENPETVYKQQPRPFKIHFATLNNIL